eukprot:Cvel_2747.t2-p1 / transcript=Cvel_2747.t2 / gene=Cvel_2747 / organism=Chromera_velia_CCMP2878 / gene_product=Zinc finger CCCH domain-containing protein 7, putative / transcript_product=Zinc finger CCCH domain-containing protein 7, putative / location=Cvel_scaffold110:51235-51912(-) / protein_length=226 / sequence_SO=supercontig / SO=protein_coding / is_pseudo=false
MCFYDHSPFKGPEAARDFIWRYRQRLLDLLEENPESRRMWWFEMMSVYARADRNISAHARLQYTQDESAHQQSDASKRVRETEHMDERNGVGLKVPRRPHTVSQTPVFMGPASQLPQVVPPALSGHAPPPPPPPPPPPGPPPSHVNAVGPNQQQRLHHWPPPPRDGPPSPSTLRAPTVACRRHSHQQPATEPPVAPRCSIPSGAYPSSFRTPRLQTESWSLTDCAA